MTALNRAELHSTCFLSDQVPALQQFTEIMSDAVIALNVYLNPRVERTAGV